jgi:hypothetical protein
MTCRQRKRPDRDPRTGITFVRQLREVPDEYLFLLGDDAPLGTFDLSFWARENDKICDPRSGGLSNVTSMAAVGRVSRFTLVNSVFPHMEHCLHREGPVVISTANTITAACCEYTAEQQAKQRKSGIQNAGNLIRWQRKTDQLSGSTQEIGSTFTFAS